MFTLDVICSAEIIPIAVHSVSVTYTLRSRYVHKSVNNGILQSTVFLILALNVVGQDYRFFVFSSEEIQLQIFFKLLFCTTFLFQESTKDFTKLFNGRRSSILYSVSCFRRKLCSGSITLFGGSLKPLLKLLLFILSKVITFLGRDPGETS